VIRPEHPVGTREQILQAALKSFAHCGYAATSVQQIVDAAQVSKPALYYHFTDKAGLFRALVDYAHDERYHLMQEAAQQGHTVAEKLEEMVASVFRFSLRHQALMRMAFATAFAAPGETPDRLKCREKGRRNFELIRRLIEDGQRSGELDESFEPDELAMGIYGILNSYVMARLLMPDCPLGRRMARRIVRLFLEGAARRGHARNGKPAGKAFKQSRRVSSTSKRA
jgi:TetR/AcrR family transcriptional regulator